jgi:predicted nucleic acid-binding protein
LYILFENVNLVPYEKFSHCLRDAIEIMEHIDVKDAPFIAVGIALNVDGIWTEDKHFSKQAAVRVYSTKDVEEILWSQTSEK